MTGGFGAVTRTVPNDYPAYARICHPAVDRGARLVAWSEVARATGRQTHPVMQWHALVGSADYLNMKGSLWPGSDPETGNLVPEVLSPLCDLLADHTATPEDCFFCLWEGWGWIKGGHTVVTSFLRASAAGAAIGPEEPIAPAFSVEELRRPRVHLPGRNYLLLAGSLAAALQIGCWLSPTGSTLSPRICSGRAIGRGASPPRSTSTRRSSAAIMYRSPANR